MTQAALSSAPTPGSVEDPKTNLNGFGWCMSRQRRGQERSKFRL
jgi:hypothetical protein